VPILCVPSMFFSTDSVRPGKAGRNPQQYCYKPFLREYARAGKKKLPMFQSLQLRRHRFKGYGALK
jgi:hypothetical protein